MLSIKIYLLLCCLLCTFCRAQSKVPYGDNAAAGHYILLNGAKHYYEVYGQGSPLLLIHGNGTASKGFAPQIEYFSKKYKVYTIDCRGRGKSELGKDSLSFIQIAKDMASFIEQIKMDSVDVIGKSDGGVVALLMGIYYPEHLKKIAAFGANLSPDTNALYPFCVKDIHAERIKAEQMLQKKDTTKNWLVEQQRYRLNEFQPHINPKDLHRIKTPVLVISCDRDVIKEEHTLLIYKNIPNANLCIFAMEKHGLPKLNPDLFNVTIDKYFSNPFKGQEFRIEK